MTDIFNVQNPAIGRTTRVLSFLTYATNFFIAIGKPTSWSGGDINPPVPPAGLLAIPEPIIYKRVQKVLPALYSTSCSNLDFDNNFNQILAQDNLTEKTYNLIEPSKLYDRDGNLISFPTLLYISTTIEAGDFTSFSFRAIGFYTNVTFNTGVNPSKIVYEASEIKKSGALHWVSYSTPILRQEGKNHTIEFLLDL